MRFMKTITPGEILLEEYLIPFGISQNALSRALGVSPRAINEIVLGRRSFTPKMSMKLGRFFEQTSEFWFRVQSNCDFRNLRKRERTLTAKVRPLALLKAARAPAAVRPLSLARDSGSGPEAGDGVDFEEAEVVPAAVLEFLLAGLG